MSDLIGQTIGRYRIVQQLGTGGMANVYKAIDTRLDRTVALKVIRSENLGEANFLERFDREARALARLNHPNIVHINEYGELDGLPYLEMDYVPGGTLENLLGKLIPWSEAARFLSPVAYALAHAHQQGIIHRDVKPSNILITNNGEPMITDFGIAKIMELDRSTLVTLPGFGVGTPAYMSPEQVLGKEIDGRSDIYSLGAVLYEMYTGHPPFRAETAMAVAVKQVHEPVPRPRRDLIPLPTAAENVVMTALAKQPEKRYQSMGIFAETLEKMGRKAPLTASKATFTAIPIPRELEDSVDGSEPPRRRRIIPFLPRFSQNRTLAVLLSLVIVVVVSTLVFGIGYAQKIREEQITRSQSPAVLQPAPGKPSVDQLKATMMNGAEQPGSGVLQVAPGSLLSAGMMSATPTVTPTLRFGPPGTIQATNGSIGGGTGGTAYPTTPPTAIPTVEPTSQPPTNIPTSPPPTSPPPTSPPPTVAPTSEPNTPVPTPAEATPTKKPKPTKKP